MVKTHRTIVMRTPDRGPHLHARGEIRNGRFTMTGNKGCQHEKMLLHVDPDCRSDVELLVSLHLRTCPGGEPMHAVANLVVDMRAERFDDAAARLMDAVGADDVRALHARILDRLANEPLRVEKGADPKRAIPDAQDAVWREEAAAFIEARCAPRWRADAERGLAALSRPDSHPDLDPHESVRRETFAGFLCVNGIGLKVSAPYPVRATGRAMGSEMVGRYPDLYACELEIGGRKAHTGFLRDPKRSARPQSFMDRPVRLPQPSREECLAEMQRQFAALEDAGPDEFPEIGLSLTQPRDGRVEDARKGLGRLRDEFVRLVGDDLYREFMEEVGPNPPRAGAGGPRP